MLKPICDIGCGFDPHGILEGIPKVTLFQDNQQKMREVRSKKGMSKGEALRCKTHSRSLFVSIKEVLVVMTFDGKWSSEC